MDEDPNISESQPNGWFAEWDEFFFEKMSDLNGSDLNGPGYGAAAERFIGADQADRFMKEIRRDQVNEWLGEFVSIKGTPRTVSRGVAAEVSFSAEFCEWLRSGQYENSSHQLEAAVEEYRRND